MDQLKSERVLLAWCGNEQDPTADGNVGKASKLVLAKRHEDGVHPRHRLRDFDEIAGVLDPIGAELAGEPRPMTAAMA